MGSVPKSSAVDFGREFLRAGERVGRPNPREMGLPDLDGIRERSSQNLALKSFIESKLRFRDEGIWKDIQLIPQQVEFIGDLFYGRPNERGEPIRTAIVWKNRGGGGSLCVAILLWLDIVYHSLSWLDMAGCLLPGTPVSTLRGWIPVESVEEGDVVITRFGERLPVTGTMVKGWSSRVTTVIPQGFGRGNTFTSDHRTWVLPKAIREDDRGHLLAQDIEAWNEAEPEWVDCGRLALNDVLVIPRPKFEVGPLPVLEVTKARNGRGEKTVVEWSDDLARFIGYWLAEGSVYSWNKGEYVRFDVSTEDEWLDDLKDIVSKLFNRDAVYDEPNGNETKEARVRFGSKDVASFLVENFGHGADGKTIPESLIRNLPESMAWNLLVGYLRGDGGVKLTCRGGHQVSSYTVSPMLSNAVYWLSLRLGLFPSMTVEEPDASRRGFIKTLPGFATSWGSVDADVLMEKAFGWKRVKERVRRQRRVWFSRDRVYVGIKKLEHSNYTGYVYDLTIGGDPSFSVPFMSVHNSGEQAKAVYNYTVDFWECMPKVKDALLADDPLLSQTVLKNGTFLKCIPNSQTQARGKHPNGLVCDEACQDDETKDRNLRAAIQAVLCKKIFKVILLSSFHVPVCLYQDYWDNAEERGFTRYYWNIYDVMETCETPVPCEKCELTNVEEYQGKKVLSGCAGRARVSSGFLPRFNAIQAKRINSIEDFAVEHEGKRPKTQGPVYDTDLVDVAWSQVVPTGEPERPVVGIDWGYGVTAVIGPIYRVDDRVVCVAEKYFSGRPVETIVEHLRFMKANLNKELIVYADAENAFANLDVENAGFEVNPVAFGKWKEFGVSNIEKYLESRKLAVSNCDKLRKVMKKMRRDKRGTIVKTRDDHGHDGFLCGMLGFIWLNEFASEVEILNEPETESSCQLI